MQTHTQTPTMQPNNIEYGYQAAEYTKRMTEKYQNTLDGRILKITDDPDVKSLEFIQSLDVRVLQLERCVNVDLRLKNDSIRLLDIINCNCEHIQELELANLHTLYLQNELKTENRTHQEYIYIKNISHFRKLKKLGIEGYKQMDINPLQSMIYLQKLDLSSNGLSNIDVLKQLINLKELLLADNIDIDITPLQYLTQLILLDLGFCNLQQIDVLQQLINLTKLDLIFNQIIFIKPLENLNKLDQLALDSNYIIDMQTLNKHRSFELYSIINQELPTKWQIRYASKLKCINQPVTQLRKIAQRRIDFKQQFTRQNLSQYLIKYGNIQHLAFMYHIAQLFSQLNTFEECQSKVSDLTQY
ncbi:leucine-rich_repeat domain-containing protein [Hexamita inflata]|uniref:Partial n=1 Tax=Hexamita inflata TaxID=28002 RepID=A0AA86P7X0_9EUKA|nr:leucine-rich repeat domain-containing protein [Hexamita inflata]